MIGQGYKQGNGDYMLFIKKQGKKIVILLVYINDMILIWNDKEEIMKLKTN